MAQNRLMNVMAALNAFGVHYDSNTSGWGGDHGEDFIFRDGKDFSDYYIKPTMEITVPSLNEGYWEALKEIPKMAEWQPKNSDLDYRYFAGKFIRDNGDGTITVVFSKFALWQDPNMEEWENPITLYKYFFVTIQSDMVSYLLKVAAPYCWE